MSGMCKEVVGTQPVPAPLLVEVRDIHIGSSSSSYAASRIAARLLTVTSPRPYSFGVLLFLACSLFQRKTASPCIILVAYHFGVPLVYRQGVARRT